MADVLLPAQNTKVTVASGDRLILGEASDRLAATWSIHLVPTGGASVAVKSRGKGATNWLTAFYTLGADGSQANAAIAAEAHINVTLAGQVALEVSGGQPCDVYVGSREG